MAAVKRLLTSMSVMLFGQHQMIRTSSQKRAAMIPTIVRTARTAHRAGLHVHATCWTMPVRPSLSQTPGRTQTSPRPAPNSRDGAPAAAVPEMTLDGVALLPPPPPPPQAVRRRALLTAKAMADSLRDTVNLQRIRVIVDRKIPSELSVALSANLRCAVSFRAVFGTCAGFGAEIPFGIRARGCARRAQKNGARRGSVVEALEDACFQPFRIQPMTSFRSPSPIFSAGLGGMGIGPQTPEPPLRTLSLSLATASP